MNPFRNIHHTSGHPTKCLFIGLMILLCAQNGVASEGSAAPGAASRINLVFIGNSITAGAGLRNRAVEAPPVHAAAKLRAIEGVQEVAFANQGVSGFTTVDFLPRTNTAFNRVVAAAQTFSGKPGLLVFSVSLGTNDSAIEGPNGSPVSAEVYKANLKTICDSLLTRFRGSIIVIHRPIWYSPNTQNTSRYLAEGLARLQSYFPEIENLVKEYQRTRPGKVFHGDTDGFAYFETNHLTDCQAENGRQGIFYLHPNAKGAAILGQLWGASIAKALGLNAPITTLTFP